MVRRGAETPRDRKEPAPSHVERVDPANSQRDRRVHADRRMHLREAVMSDKIPPRLLTVREAEDLKMVHDLDPVIGITVGGQARAYPIDSMGVHELGNDVIADVPIAVTW